jgi:threonine/homoserine/homoserine lactone efflux protein
MSVEIWAAFAAASALVIAIPGPTVLLVCAYALGAGRAAATWVAAGVALGDFVAMSASLLGLGALLAASGDAFAALRLIGGLYLVFLGVKLWRASPEAGLGARKAAAPGWRMAAHAFAVTATNPKSIVFFIAFTPLFLDAAEPLAPQAAIMIATFTVIGGANALLYALAAGTLRARLARPGALRWMNRGGGAALCGMGATTALGARPG